MQEAMTDIGLTLWQSAVILSLILMVVGLLRPNWFFFWMEEPKPFYLFVITALLFMGSYFGLGLKVGNPWPIAAIHAVILFSILFLVAGLVNPAWVFGKPLDRLWVMIVAAALFMGFMTLQGMYYGPKGKRRHPLPGETPPATEAQSPPQTPLPSGQSTGESSEAMPPASQPQTLPEVPSR